MREGACGPTRPTQTRPAVAAVCVYTDLVGVAKQALAGSGVKVAASRPRSRPAAPSWHVKLADTGDAVAAGADEIDMVIDRGAFLSGRYLQVLDEIVAVRAACGDGPAARTSR